MGIGPVDLREIEKKTANIYEAIIISGKKARMINEDDRETPAKHWIRKTLLKQTCLGVSCPQSPDTGTNNKSR